MKSLLCYSCLFFFLFTGKNSIDAQSKIDSIQLELIALNESYHKKLTALYKEMFELSRDTTNKEYLMARLQFHLFPIEENINFLLDNMNYQVYSENYDYNEMYPYWAILGKFIHENGQSHPAFMKKIMAQLDQEQTDEDIFLYSALFQTYFFWNVAQTLDTKDIAAYVRIIANSIVGVSVRKQNLLKIANKLEEW